MGHFFAIFIGIDIMDLEIFNFMSNQRKIRIIVYSLNLFFMSIIIASDIDYFYNDETVDTAVSLGHYSVNVVEAGYFILAFICLFIMVSLIMSVFMSAWLIDSIALRRFCGLFIVISAGMILYGVELTVGVPAFNCVLSLVPMIMIVYDLQCME